MNKFRLPSFREAWRVIWLLGLVFAIVLLIRHFELPYGGVLPSFLAAAKAHVAPGGSLSYVSSSADSKASENRTFSISSGHSNGNEEGGNSKFVGQTHSSGNITDVVSGHDDEYISSDKLGNNTNLEPKKGSNDRLGSDDAIKAKDEKIASSSVNGSYYSLNQTGKADKHPVSFVVPPPDSTPIYPRNVDTHLKGPATPGNLNSSSGGNEALVLPKPNDVPSIKNSSSVNNIPTGKDSSNPPPSIVVPISQMNDMLLQSRASYRAMKPRWSSTVDHELSRAKSLIENTIPVGDEPTLDPTLFRNISMFRRSYELMEKTLKVFIYPEGESPIFHHAVLQGIYASESWFMKLLKENKVFVTKTPSQAHLFYLPFSSRMLVEVLYVPNSPRRDNLVQHLINYLNVITSKYRFWNRTDGADHFLVACHDWAPSETQKIMANCIRALCNTDLVKEGFQFGKDISLPETLIRRAQNPLFQRGGNPPSERNILAFFAGKNHGYLRPILFEYWRDKDPDMQIFGKLPKKGPIEYVHNMKNSKYCICPKGYEVNSPRVVEAIFYECVPVIISDNFVPPLFETLNWESFAVFVLEKDIPNLKDILESIPEKRYLAMQRNVKQVQRHFLWHPEPEKYDIFHMILHSIWYTRVFQI